MNLLKITNQEHYGTYIRIFIGDTNLDIENRLK